MYDKYKLRQRCLTGTQFPRLLPLSMVTMKARLAVANLLFTLMSVNGQYLRNWVFKTSWNKMHLIIIFLHGALLLAHPVLDLQNIRSSASRNAIHICFVWGDPNTLQLLCVFIQATISGILLQIVPVVLQK